MKLGHTAVKLRNHAMRSRPLPPRENPMGVPKAVMRALQQETLAGDLRPYSVRLQQLLTLHELNKGGGNYG
jgi:hypothetical protein